MSKENIKNKDILSREELILYGVCPYCWNDMAYYNGFFSYMEDRTKADIHGPKDQKKAFIEKFVQDNITGIHLKNDKNRHFCPNCERDFLFEEGKVDNQNESSSEKS